MRALPLLPALFLLLVLAAAGCHESSANAPLPSVTSTTNLGLEGIVFREGGPRVLLVSEAQEARDLDGDGDTVDLVAHVVDAEFPRVTNTGLVIGARSLYSVPPLVVSTGPTLAFGVDEHATGGLDRNGDGDAADSVLALYDRDSDTVINLGLAVTFVETTEDLLAFDVTTGLPDDYETEPFVRDRRTGETWSVGPKGTLSVLTAAGEVVALAAHEEELGDLTGDGDETDDVAAFYDVATRTLRLTRFSLRQGPEYNLQAPVPHGKRWSIVTGESASEEHVIYEPSTGIERNLGDLLSIGSTDGIEPFVLAEPAGRGMPGQAPVVWLYDPETDALTSTGLHGLDVNELGGRLVVSVDEAAQGEDLDRNGALESVVTVLYDPASGVEQNLGTDGYVQASEVGLLIQSNELRSRRDWNGDGDRDDTVLFTWDSRLDQLVNTRLAPASAASPLGGELALLTLEERTGDLNGDGDRDDRVLHVYDIGQHRLTNLGLAMRDAPPRGFRSSVYPVGEADQGRDLNDDGDQLDEVLHRTELVFLALR